MMRRSGATRGKDNARCLNKDVRAATKEIATPVGTPSRLLRCTINPEAFPMAQSLSYFDNHPQNLSSRERTISVVLGLGLAASAARPRPNPWLSVAALIGGSYLAIRGATGRDPLKEVVQRLLGHDGAADPALAAAPVRQPAKRRTRKT